MKVKNGFYSLEIEEIREFIIEVNFIHLEKKIFFKT